MISIHRLESPLETGPSSQTAAEIIAGYSFFAIIDDIFEIDWLMKPFAERSHPPGSAIFKPAMLDGWRCNCRPRVVLVVPVSSGHASLLSSFTCNWFCPSDTAIQIGNFSFVTPPMGATVRHRLTNVVVDTIKTGPATKWLLAVC